MEAQTALIDSFKTGIALNAACQAKLNSTCEAPPQFAVASAAECVDLAPWGVGLILSHHSRFSVTCGCNKEKINDDDGVGDWGCTRKAMHDTCMAYRTSVIFVWTI